MNKDEVRSTRCEVISTKYEVLSTVNAKLRAEVKGAGAMALLDYLNVATKNKSPALNIQRGTLYSSLVTSR